MAAKRDTSNAGIYDRLDALRLEVKQDISTAVNSVTSSTASAVNALAVSQGRLEKKFDDLEAGRLTRLEGRYNDLSIRLVEAEGKASAQEATVTTKVAILYTVLTALASAAITIALARLVR